jgi:hypothetical protein
VLCSEVPKGKSKAQVVYGVCVEEVKRGGGGRGKLVRRSEW